MSGVGFGKKSLIGHLKVLRKFEAFGGDQDGKQQACNDRELRVSMSKHNLL